MRESQGLAIATVIKKLLRSAFRILLRQTELLKTSAQSEQTTLHNLSGGFRQHNTLLTDTPLRDGLETKLST